MQVGNGGQMVLHAWVAVAAGRMAPLKKLGEAPCSRSLEAQARMLLDDLEKKGEARTAWPCNSGVVLCLYPKSVC